MILQGFILASGFQTSCTRTEDSRSLRCGREPWSAGEWNGGRRAPANLRLWKSSAAGPAPPTRITGRWRSVYRLSGSEKPLPGRGGGLLGSVPAWGRGDHASELLGVAGCVKIAAVKLKSSPRHPDGEGTRGPAAKGHLQAFGRTVRAPITGPFFLSLFSFSFSQDLFSFPFSFSF